MQHCDPETLALTALGDGSVVASAQDRAHLDGCAECRHELRALSEVVRTGRDGSVAGELVEPPARVWQGIVDQLGIDGALAAGARFVPAQRRWARRTALVAAAAAVVGLAMGCGLTWLVTRASPSEQVVAQAQLDPLDAPAANGTAVVSSTSSQREITVRVSGLTEPPGTFYEVWLLDRKAGRLVSLGVLGVGETGTFVLPKALDLQEYPVVDVSLQVLNGDPKHSGRSVVRGTLRT